MIYNLKVQIEKHLTNSSSALFENRAEADALAVIRANLGDLDQHHAQIGHVFRKLSFRLSSTLFYDLKQTQKGCDEYFMSPTATVIPVGLEQICSALSSMLIPPTKSCSQHLIDDPRTTFATRLHIQCGLEQNSSSKLVAYMVGCRYI
ncbi:unnamed protein product [Phytophthora lilii]|uniref:Unnamed protein product n=1 Tax=Phytophthora lilii TaxID=2077276 RepID=A0A9W6TSB6_9STRA|nr:unnamed protein product [Phytophthora lilii]